MWDSSDLQGIRQFHYPRYDELPEELVFLDEVVEIVNTVHGSMPARARNNHKQFTSSMASNYVKQKLTPSPIGKKYAREHICLILLAATLKLVYSAEDTVALAKAIFADEARFAQTQDMVAEAVENAMRVCAMTADVDSEEAKHEALVSLALTAFAAKTVSLL